jgi:hypothetical protein
MQFDGTRTDTLTPSRRLLGFCVFVEVREIVIVSHRLPPDNQLPCICLPDTASLLEQIPGRLFESVSKVFRHVVVVILVAAQISIELRLSIVEFFEIDHRAKEVGKMAVKKGRM